MSDRPDRRPVPATHAAELTARVMDALRVSRPLFHTEADFQHAFAWEAHRLRPNARVRLERRLSAGSNERLDLLLYDDDLTIAVELKYPAAKLDTVVDGEPFVLRAQGAEDRQRFNYVWDIDRLEALVAVGVADVGVAVLLSNFAALWSGSFPVPRSALRPPIPSSASTPAANSPVAWPRPAMLPEAVELTGRYPIAWQSYSDVPGAGRGEFRWTAAVIAG